MMSRLANPAKISARRAAKSFLISNEVQNQINESDNNCVKLNQYGTPERQFDKQSTLSKKTAKTAMI